MFKKIKEYFETRKAYKNAKRYLVIRISNLLANDYDDFKITITALNSKFYDLIVTETEAKEAEKAAYESMNTFGENFKVEDLSRLVAGIDKIANNPNLQTSYFQQVNKNAHKERNAEIIRDTVSKVVK